jgi:hypothetical protein
MLTFQVLALRQIAIHALGQQGVPVASDDTFKESVLGLLSQDFRINNRFPQSVIVYVNLR